MSTSRFSVLAFHLASLLLLLVALPVNAQESLDSTRIAFHSNRDAGGGRFQMYSILPDGTDLRRLTNNSAQEGGAAWSPDGETIAFFSDRDGNWELYLMNADGTGQTRLTCHPAEDSPNSFAPDGRLLAFRSDRDGNDEIYVMDIYDGSVWRLTYTSAYEGLPLWSPDGSKIAFTSTRDGNFEIYVMNADGTGQTRLTYNPTRDFPNAWSPDGTKILYHSGPDGSYDLLLMDADGGNVTVLAATTPFSDHNGTFSPDGSRIAFLSDRNQRWSNEIYIMNSDGSDQTRITFDSAQDYRPRWSPVLTPALNVALVPFDAAADLDGDGYGDACDQDGDGVLDAADLCPDTAIPEVSVPGTVLRTNRFALTDSDNVFDTEGPNGKGPRKSLTTVDTLGCSCEQIIAAQGLGQGHVKYGCSISAMEDWISAVED